MLDENKTEYIHQLVITLKENGFKTTIDSKESMKEAYNHMQDLIVDSFYEQNEFDKFTEYEAKQKTNLSKLLKNGHTAFLSVDNEVLVTPSAKELGKHQITYFDRFGAKSDSQQDNLEMTVTYLIDNRILPINKEWLEYLKPEGVRNMNKENALQERNVQLLRKQALER